MSFFADNAHIFTRLVEIILFFFLAWVLHRLSGRLARRVVRLGRLAGPESGMRRQRQHTLQSLIASGITLLGFISAGILSLGLFIQADTLIWIIGLFSAAFGLGARPLISDFLTGLSFIFEDTFDVGEKVEILGVEGVVEEVNLRTTKLRAPGGEVFIMPNGEVRVVRNFSRGRFSLVKVQLKLDAAELGVALPALEAMREEAMTALPNLLEPWRIISETGTLGEHAELTLVAKARFGKAADMRPRLLAFLQEQLADIDISRLTKSYPQRVSHL